MRMSVSHSGRN